MCMSYTSYTQTFLYISKYNIMIDQIDIKILQTQFLKALNILMYVYFYKVHNK